MYRFMGRYEEAIDLLQASLAIRRDLGDRRGEAASLNLLGVTFGHLGRHSEAIDHLQESLRDFRDLGDRRGEADALRDLGDVYRAVGRTDEAQSAWQDAFALSEALHIPEAEDIRARLANLSA